MKKDTLIVLFILAVVLAAYFIWKNWEPQTSAETAEPTATSSSYLLFTSDLGLLTSLRITDGRTTVKLERDPAGPWSVRLPRPGQADPARAGAAEIQVMSLRVLNQVEADLSPEVLGVDDPSYTIDLVFAGGATYRLEVGRKTPTGSGYYVRVNGVNYIIGVSGIDALSNLLVEPPYPATPTPEPATETPTPSPEETPPSETPVEATPTPTTTP